jgi:hypothetical protein
MRVKKRLRGRMRREGGGKRIKEKKWKRKRSNGVRGGRAMMVEWNGMW